jgi:hypothetical protein
MNMSEVVGEHPPDMAGFVETLELKRRRHLSAPARRRGQPCHALTVSACLNHHQRELLTEDELKGLVDSVRSGGGQLSGW